MMRATRNQITVVLAASVLLVVSSLAAAQPAPDPVAPKPVGKQPAGDAATLEGRIKALEFQLGKLKSRIESLTEDNKDLQTDLEDVEKELRKPRKQPNRLNLMNPTITVFGNGAVRADNKRVMSNGGARIDDGVFMRSAEIDFRSAVDPYADGVLMLALEGEAGEGFEVDVEEMYLVLKRLPLVEKAPLGLKLKAGRFRPALGNVNRLHMHDLPWTTRPLPVAHYLGTEHGEFFESGYNVMGIDAEMILPQIIPGTVMELNLDVLDGGRIAVTEDVNGWDAGFLGRLNTFFTAQESHDFNIGLSAYFEGGSPWTTLLVGDVFYKWKPHKAGEFRSLVVGGELFYVLRQDQNKAPIGWFAFVQYQLTWHLYAGARFDWLRDLTDPNATTRVAAGYASYYTSEFLRFRAGFERRDSDITASDNLNSFFFELNFVFGSHPIEPYWVNR